MTTVGDPIPPYLGRKRPRETVSERFQRRPGEALIGVGVAVLVALGSAVIAKVESCEAQDRAIAATVQASTTQVLQGKADVELGAAYKAIAEKLEALATLAGDQAKRLDRLEEAMGKRLKPATAQDETALEEAQEPLPASPAAAAAKESE